MAYLRGGGSGGWVSGFEEREKNWNITTVVYTISEATRSSRAALCAHCWARRRDATEEEEEEEEEEEMSARMEEAKESRPWRSASKHDEVRLGGTMNEQARVPAVAYEHDAGSPYGKSVKSSSSSTSDVGNDDNAATSSMR